MRPYLQFGASQVLCLCLLLWFGIAGAGGLGVSPIRVDLSDSQPTAALTLVNNGPRAAVVQTQLLSWSAAGDAEHYLPTDDIVAAPPIATIQPGQTQIVRVGLNREADPGSELAYRLYIEEVPPPPTPGQQGLQIALRIGVPIFIEPVQPARPQLEWHAIRSGDHSLAITATNTGNAHLRLLSLKLRPAGAEGPVIEQQIVGYLLPGQSRRWAIPLKSPLPDGRMHLSVATKPNVADVDLELENP